MCSERNDSRLAVEVDSLDELHAFYRIGESIVINAIPSGAVQLVALHASGNAREATTDHGFVFADLKSGTYAVRALDERGQLVGEVITTVGSSPAERPVHGFATSFQDDDAATVLEWHRSLRSTVVQVYDWMASYTEPLGPVSGWQDPSHRPVSFDALRALAHGLRSQGAVMHAYVPIYAVGNEFAQEHPEMLMYEDDGEAIRFLDQIVLADPGNEEWQKHFVRSYGDAALAIGFDGFHIDTYGYPRVAFDVDARPIDLRVAYESFLAFVRDAWSEALLSFNQVNGVPSAAQLPLGPGFRYCEVWPPNTEWRHLEGLLDRSSGRAGHLGASLGTDSSLRGSIACYPPVWGVDSPSGPIEGVNRQDSLRTDLLTEAIATTLGASALIFGDKGAALCDPYYPKHARLSSDEQAVVLRWRHFALRCRDLFIDGEDTSWYEIGDENGAVSVEADVPVRPEPTAGTVFARVVHGDGLVTVGAIDLTGSETARWTQPTARGSVTGVTVRVLVEHPERWLAFVAVLGSGDAHFVPISTKVVTHRQGRALEVAVPMIDGWSVLRLNREQNND